MDKLLLEKGLCLVLENLIFEKDPKIIKILDDIYNSCLNNFVLRIRDDKQRGLSHYACMYNNAVVLNYLISKWHIDLHHDRDIEGKSPLMYSIEWGSYDCFNILKAYGDIPYWDLDNGGNSIFHYAAMQESYLFFNDLVNLKTDFDFMRKNKEGESVIDIAIKNDFIGNFVFSYIIQGDIVIYRDLNIDVKEKIKYWFRDSNPLFLAVQYFSYATIVDIVKKLKYHYSKEEYNALMKISLDKIKKEIQDYAEYESYKLLLALK